MKMIEVQGVGHWFGQRKVLDDVWFEVHKGETFGFIGPNGAGKTTTLRMMATLLNPRQGRILIGGHDVVEAPQKVRKILGFMPDGFGVYPSLTVDEYLEFFAAAYGIEGSARRRTIDAVADLTNLGPMRSLLVSVLSKGMTQRLAIARTLLHDPEVLILDEPAAGLDPHARIELRELIAHLTQMDKTVILSSHILTELSDMVSSVAILEAGRVRVAGNVSGISNALERLRVLKLRLLHYPPGCESVFLALPEVERAERGPDGHLRIAHRGGDEAIAAIARAAVLGGMDLLRVEPERTDLEQIFLEVTRGQVQ